MRARLSLGHGLTVELASVQLPTAFKSTSCNPPVDRPFANPTLCLPFATDVSLEGFGEQRFMLRRSLELVI